MSTPQATVTLETVKPMPDGEYLVTITGPDDSTSEHRVTVPSQYVAALGWSEDEASITELLETAFRFLLARESQTAILPEFSLTVIDRYFPEFSDHAQKTQSLSKDLPQ